MRDKLMHWRKRVKGNRQMVGAFGLRIRVWAAALVLLAAGGAALLAGSRLVSHSSPSTGAHPRVQRPVAALAPDTVPGAPASPLQSAVSSSNRGNLFASLPLMFEPNQGQANLDPADARAKFVARGKGYSLFLGPEGAILSRRVPGDNQTVTHEALMMKLAGANPSPALIGQDRLPGQTNYFIGNDPSKWRRAVPQFAGVRYEQIYPGINLVFYGNQGSLEYDFRVAPGADPRQPELEFEGANRLELKDGALIVRSANRDAGNDLRLEPPQVYQQVAGGRQSVAGSFTLRGGNRAGFEIGAYDRSRELVIDPVLTFSTYFGGSGDEHNTFITAPLSGFIYVTGSTDSANLPVANALFPQVYQATQPAAGATNVYIASISPPFGTAPAVLNFVTYLGGTGPDIPVGVGVDAGGNIYVAGTTSSANFPVSDTAYQSQPLTPGLQHVFVTELSSPSSSQPIQTLEYSSYLSGNNADVASGMTIDSSGDIFVTGTTLSTNPGNQSLGIQFPASVLPQEIAYQPIPDNGGTIQFFVTKVNTNASKTGSIAYSTYFGGGSFFGTLVAQGGGVAVDLNGNIYFDGTTNFYYTGTSLTTDFPILNAYQPCLDQTPPTVIVGTPTCTNTASTSTFPDAFVAKLNPNAQNGTAQLQWSTYLGGSQSDSATAIGLDPNSAADVYITGTTNSQDFNLSTFPSYQKCLNNLPQTPSNGQITCTTQTDPAPTDAYVARFNNLASGTTLANVSLTYFSYLGGAGNETGLNITVDNAQGAVLTGTTQSTATTPPSNGSFPVAPSPNTIQNNLTGQTDAFVARINTAAAINNNSTATWANYFGGSVSAPPASAPSLTEGTSAAIDTNQLVYIAGDTNAIDLPVREPLSANLGGSYNGGYDAYVTQFGSAASLSLSGVLTLGTNQTYIAAGNQATFTYTLTNSGPDLANNITITDTLINTGVPLTYYSASITAGTCSGSATSTTVSCTLNSLQSGSTATVTIVLIPTASTSGAQARFNGGTVVATAANAITAPSSTVYAQMSDYVLSVTPTSVSIPLAGDPARYQVSLQPNPVYTTNVSLSVSGLPTGATSSFSTSPVVLEGTSPGTSTLTISTTPRPIVLPQDKSASLWTRHFYALWLPVPVMFLAGMGTGRRRKRALGWLMLGIVASIIFLQPACSHQTTPPPATGTPAGTYTLTLTAAAGSDTKSETIVLVVP